VSKIEILVIDVPASKHCKNYMILDSGCTATVCGRAWLNCYLDSLSPDQLKCVERRKSNTIFQFGGGERLKSQGQYEIPVTILDRNMCIQTDVVDSSIPLLWSRKDMKSASVKIDLENDRLEVLGQNVPMEFTESGHICLPLLKPMEVLFTSLTSLRGTELDKALTRLHRQFAHPSNEKLRKLIVEAGQWMDECTSSLQNIEQNCEVCKIFRRTPSRPVVSLPLADDFNQIICMDLKTWRTGRYILHMIDAFSRLTVSTFIPNKLPETVINGFLRTG
jgi:hypothetical protein